MAEPKDSFDESPDREHGQARVPLLDEDDHPAHRVPRWTRKDEWRCRLPLILALLISNGLWAAFFFFSFWKSECNALAPNQRPETDFSSISSYLSKTKQMVFDDQLRYNPTKDEFWRDLDDSLPQYFGPPSPAIDSAWANLLRGEFIGVSPEEILKNPDLHQDFDDNDRNPITGQFHIAIDVIHSLHCLNAVRKELDKDYYSRVQTSSNETSRSHDKASSIEKRHGHDSSEGMSDASQRAHIDHCLNHVRQSLQCHPDLSPAAMKKQVTETGDMYFLGNSKRHTCVNWSEVEEWIEERSNSKYGSWDECAYCTD